jgi:hypothetical protein
VAAIFQQACDRAAEGGERFHGFFRHARSIGSLGT